MTFESMIENININADNEPLAVKVSYGDELRRTNFNGVAFEALRDTVAKLFGLDPASVVLKYQDDDGDKITMSSDSELKDAIQLAKEKKILRLFVDVKGSAAPAQVQEDGENFPPHFYHPFAARRFGGPLRGGFRGPFGYGPHRGGPHHGPNGPHGHPHPHHPPHGFPPGPPTEDALRPSHPPHRGGPHHGPHHGGPHGHPHGPHHGGPHGHPPGPHHGGPHGFPPGTPTDDAQRPPCGRGGPYGGPWAHKAHKHAMKEHRQAMKESMKERKHEFKHQIKLMKENATTPDDFLAIKEYKKQIRAEWKANWKQSKPKCHDDKKDRFIAKHVADVTIPDNSELPADTPVTKTWRLRNVGATAWPKDSQLIFISRRGDNLNGPERVHVGAVEPQKEVDVSLTFITPSEPGRYVGYYRMATSDCAKFGQRVWVSFLIPQGQQQGQQGQGAAPSSTPLSSDLAMD